MTAHFPSFYDAYRKRRSVIITLKMKKKLTPFLPFVPRLIAIFQRRTKGWGKKFFCFYTNLARTNHRRSSIRSNISPPPFSHSPHLISISIFSSSSLLLARAFVLLLLAYGNRRISVELKELKILY